MADLLSIAGREHDLGGGFVVRRLLPDVKRRSVGPFIFLDHMGPHDFPAGQGIDVRPHPHIGLSTLTWLWEGALMHRDSVGSVQVIRPGDVNWMTAGRGIVHSERTPEDERQRGQRVEGLQTWLAMPEADAESAPSFQHVPAAEVPACIATAWTSPSSPGRPSDFVHRCAPAWQRCTPASRSRPAAC